MPGKFYAVRVGTVQRSALPAQRFEVAALTRGDALREAESQFRARHTLEPSVRLRTEILGSWE